MRNHYGYGSYRGRGGFRTFLKILVGVLTAVLVFLVAGYFFLQQFAVVTDKGVYYDIPFLRGKEQRPSPSQPIAVETPPLIIAPTPTPTPEPEPVEDPLRAVLLPTSALYDGTAQAQMEAAEGNAVIFDMKADDGTLPYVSQVQRAKDLKASGSDHAVNEGLEALTGSGVYTIARVSCFKDNNAPYRNNALSIKTNSGYNWRDEENLRWMSPTNEEARQYVTDLCVELARLGFDEILLDNAAYPVAGHLEYIKVGTAYDKTQFSAVVDGFYAQIKAALAPYPEVKLSIIGTQDAVRNGTDPISGQSAAGLTAHADRVWLLAPEGDTADYTAALTRAGMKNIQTGLVLLTDTPLDTEESWGILP